MLKKMFLVILSLELIACGTSNRQVIPSKLAPNEVVVWHYTCKDAYGIDIEYANMGGEYSATIYNKEISKHVLPKVSKGKFANNEWEWSQDSPTTFQLINNDEIITSNCRSYSEVENSGIVLLR